MVEVLLEVREVEEVVPMVMIGGICNQVLDVASFMLYVPIEKQRPSMLSV